MKDCDDCRYWDRTSDDPPCCECMDYSEYEEPESAPVKTWLDECAMMAMAGLIESAFTHMTEESEQGKPMTPGAVSICEEIGKTAYVIADKMLAEKLRREKEAAEQRITDPSIWVDGTCQKGTE